MTCGEKEERVGGYQTDFFLKLKLWANLILIRDHVGSF